MILTELVAAVFEVPADEVTEDTARNDVEAWNSLAHVKLVVALEEAYGVRLSADDVKGLTSIGKARMMLAERGVAVD